VSLDFTRLTVHDLGRNFGRRKALARVSFACEAGEIVGLLGPNGAGKSTLLAILATLLQPSTGHVAYGDLGPEAAGAALRSRVGLLGHDLYLYPELTARENLRFFAELYGVSDATACVARGLEKAQLSDRADDQVLSFSRGMRQRLALERALVHDPRLLLLDEPFTGLDQKSAAALVARLSELRTGGCLVLVATHDLDIVDGLLTRAIFLRQGRIAADEPGAAGRVPLWERYQRVIHQG
jgi:heme exporter protein A